jgi:hypothetical protein
MKKKKRREEEKIQIVQVEEEFLKIGHLSVYGEMPGVALPSKVGDGWEARTSKGRNGRNVRRVHFIGNLSSLVQCCRENDVVTGSVAGSPSSLSSSLSLGGSRSSAPSSPMLPRNRRTAWMSNARGVEKPGRCEPAICRRPLSFAGTILSSSSGPARAAALWTMP